MICQTKASFYYRTERKREADIQWGYQLVKYDIFNDRKTIIYDAFVNKPFICSPDGKYGLYGFHFEEIIDLEKANIRTADHF